MARFLRFGEQIDQSTLMRQLIEGTIAGSHRFMIRIEEINSACSSHRDVSVRQTGADRYPMDLRQLLVEQSL